MTLEERKETPAGCGTAELFGDLTHVKDLEVAH
jgi:hypothetical protein